jgi:hypothetical protein
MKARRADLPEAEAIERAQIRPPADRALRVPRRLRRRNAHGGQRELAISRAHGRLFRFDSASAQSRIWRR